MTLSKKICIEDIDHKKYRQDWNKFQDIYKKELKEQMYIPVIHRYYFNLVKNLISKTNYHNTSVIYNETMKSLAVFDYLAINTLFTKFFKNTVNNYISDKNTTMNVKVRLNSYCLSVFREIAGDLRQSRLLRFIIVYAFTRVIKALKTKNTRELEQIYEILVNCEIDPSKFYDHFKYYDLDKMLEILENEKRVSTNSATT